MTEVMEKLAGEDDRRQQRRGQIDRLLDRLEYLEGEERVLLEMRFRHGLTFGQLALLTGHSRKTITGLIRRLARRLVAREYITIVAHGDRFSGEELQVAYDHYLLGMGYRRIAAKRDIKAHQVRLIVRQLHEWIKAKEITDGQVRG